MIVPENDHPSTVPEHAATVPTDLFAAYALHALAPEERATVETYLAAHPEAVDEVTALKESAAMLPYGVPSLAPSPNLRLRLMARVYQEALEEHGNSPRTVRPVPIQRTRRGGVVWPFAAAILLFLTVGFGGWAAALNGDVRHKDQVIATQRGAIAQAGSTSPVVGTAPNAAHGELLKLANPQAAVLTISGLPPLANGKVYEVWFIAGTTPVGAGIFSPNADGSWSGLVRGDITTAQAIAISVEPLGGSTAPTGAIVAKGSL